MKKYIKELGKCIEKKKSICLLFHAALLVIGLLVPLVIIVFLIDYFVGGELVVNFTSSFYNKGGLNGIAIAVASIAGLILFVHRNQAMIENTKILEDNQLRESHFVHFNSATKMLTDKDATLDAKISALYQLYDVGKSFEKSLGRVLQVINQPLTPLNKNIDKQLELFEEGEELEKLKFLTLSPNLTFKNLYHLKQRDLKEWVIKGNEQERLMMSALKIQKKIFETQLIKKDMKKVDFSHCIFFGIDSIDKGNCLFSTQRSEYVTFLNCTFNEFSFENTKLHLAQFINCSFTSGKLFLNADLWGATFLNCDFDGKALFNKAYCGSMRFINCRMDKEKNEAIVKMVKDMKPSESPSILDKIILLNLKEVELSFIKEDETELFKECQKSKKTTLKLEVSYFDEDGCKIELLLNGVGYFHDSIDKKMLTIQYVNNTRTITKVFFLDRKNPRPSVVSYDWKT